MVARLQSYFGVIFAFVSQNDLSVVLYNFHQFDVSQQSPLHKKTAENQGLVSS